MRLRGVLVRPERGDHRPGGEGQGGRLRAVRAARHRRDPRVLPVEAAARAARPTLPVERAARGGRAAAVRLRRTVGAGHRGAGAEPDRRGPAGERLGVLRPRSAQLRGGRPGPHDRPAARRRNGRAPADRGPGARVRTLRAGRGHALLLPDGHDPELAVSRGLRARRLGRATGARVAHPVGGHARAPAVVRPRWDLDLAQAPVRARAAGGPERLVAVAPDGVRRGPQRGAHRGGVGLRELDAPAAADRGGQHLGGSRPERGLSRRAPALRLSRPRPGGAGASERGGVRTARGSRTLAARAHVREPPADGGAHRGRPRGRGGPARSMSTYRPRASSRTSPRWRGD